jgi:molybdate transport system substrate-binding protein
VIAGRYFRSKKPQPCDQVREVEKAGMQMRMPRHVNSFFAAVKFVPVAALLLSGGAFAQSDSQKVANAKPGEMRLFISNGLREPFKTVRAEAEKLVGKPFAVEYGASRGMQTQIEAGQAFDVAILTPDVIADMIAKSKMVAGSSTDLAHVPVAIGIRGQAKIDIGTAAAMKTALLGARNVGFAAIGASRPTVDNMFTKLGVTDALKSRIVGTPPTNDKTPMPPNGQYDLVINLVSEILPLTGGWNYAGNVPQELQVPVIMSAGIGAQGDAAAAKKLIAFLQGPAIEPGLKANNMTR